MDSAVGSKHKVGGSNPRMGVKISTLIVGNSQKFFLVSNSSKVCLMMLGHDNHATTKGL